MKTFTKTTLALLTAAVMTTSAFANDTVEERLQSAKGSVEALGTTLENMGANVDTSVDLSGAYTFSQKASVYNAKHAELQEQFNTLNAQ